MLIGADPTSYDALRAGFAWEVPARMNIAELCADRHDPDRLALVEDQGERVTYGELTRRSQRAAGALLRLGVEAGDRVGVKLRPGVANLATHLAVLRLGAISVPISGVYDGDAVRYRLADSGARVYVTDARGRQSVAGIPLPPTLRQVVSELEGDPVESIADTASDDPAFIFYTSGTSGQAKGAVLPHQFLYGHLPGYQLVFDLAPQPGDVFFTPSDWAWIGSLGTVVLPTCFFGYPQLAVAGRFSVEATYRALAEHRVTCPFFAPAVLRRMRAQPPPRSARFALRAIMTGGEALAPELRRFVADTFAVSLNNVLGQTEANHLACGCAALFVTPPGAVGRVVPGRRVAVLDAAGLRVAPGTSGELCLAADDPIVMRGYYRAPSRTAAKIRDGWVHLGDGGRVDQDGFLYFDGRLDDLINVAGVRLGPDEVESALLTHPDCAEVGACAAPAPDGGDEVWVFVRLRHRHLATPQLASALTDLVTRQVGRHATPSQLLFVDALPATSTGKIQRAVLRQWCCTVREAPAASPG